MKHTGFFNRFLSVLLVVAMLVGNVMPALATGTDGNNASGTNISFTRVDNSEVTAGLTPSGKTEITDEEEYDAKEMVRVSIILKKASTLEAGFSTMDIGSNNAAMAYSDSLKNDQKNVIQQIEWTIRSDLDVVWNLTLVANMISAYVEYGQIEAIKKLPGVKTVVLESEYTPNKVEFSDSITYMGTSGLQIGSQEAWNSGYTGAGMRIAVIDTGIDTDHQSLNAVAYEYALEQLAEQKGMTKEAYMESLDLLDAEEIASVANRLNVTVDPERVSVSSKIAYAYNYRDFDYDVTHDNDEEGDHGSHVAGIATANSWLYNPTSGNYGKAMDYCFMQGVAPEAQLLVMKVFGKGGSPYDSDFFAAIEDAIVLGADAINLSLGSTVPGRGHHTNAEFQSIMDDLANSGVVVAISAGNAGAWVEYSENGYLYNTDVSMDTVSQPGSFTNSLCVASVENDGMVGYYLDVNGQVLVYNEDNRDGEFSNRPFREIAGEYEYIFIDGVGKKADWDAVASVLPGKIAVCSRGETNFVEKATLAVEAGAIAVLIYNNQSGIITLDLTEYTYTMPVAALTKNQGQMLRELSTPVKDSAGNVLYYTGTMKVMNDIAMGQFGSEYYTMSDFSSWGVPGSLEMKPEITAPGGNIFSIEGMNKSGAGYAIKSGTSMASPQVAGMAALLAQYVQENDLTDKTGLTARQLIQSLLMSTATPLLAQQDQYWSILQQGAGLANVNDAINADSYIMMGEGTDSGAADGKVKVELFDDPDRTGSYSATFTISNLTNVEKAINLSADFFIQSLLSDDEGYLYMDTATVMIPMNVIWTIGGARVTSDSMDMSAMDFNGDGLVNVEDGQLLLDYATGKTVVLQNQSEADVDGDGDIDSHDAYVFLSNLSTTTAVLPANGSVEIRVDFSLTASMKDQLEQMYPNGTYLQGYLYAETENTTHSIPVLGFYGNWTDASMFDVGTWPTYDTGEDTRLPYTGILRGNDFQVRYADDPNYHYTLGGNPVITDAVYMPERNAINSNNYIHGVRFTPIRHADQSRVMVVNNTTGSVILDQKTGAVNMAYYPNELYGWQNAMMIVETNFSLKNTSENDQIAMSFTLVPEYYIDESGNVDWDALGEGASRHMNLVIDNTAPELKGVSVDVINNTMTIVASDNQYIAAVGLYNKTGTRRLAATGSKQDIEKGETAEYTFSLDGINGKKFLVQVHDYAMNTVTYLLEMQIGENAGVPDMMAYDLVQRHWTTFTKDFVYDYKVGTPRLEYADHVYYAATIAEHYVFASTSKGELYVMPEDDLSDTTFVVNMGVILYDMAYNKADGQIYAVTEGNNLVVIDKLSGELTKVAEMPKRTNTLACSPEGVFYFNELGTGRIWSCTLETLNAPVLLMEDAYLTEKDPISGDRNGTEGNMGMEYDPNKNIICWNSHLEILAGSYITFAYYYEIDPATGAYTRYNDFWHEMSCLMIPDETGRTNNWAEPTDKVTAVSLNKSSVEIIKGTTAKVIANVQPWTATNRDVTWSSADTSVATVDENGVITGIAPGTTWITAASKLDPTKTASCEVTVNLLQVTINGTVIDTENNAMFYSWNMAEDNTWTAGAAVPVSITSATYSPALNAYYMMEITEALQMHRVGADGSLQASAINENSIPLWDMAYSEVFSTEQTEMVTSIYYSYLLSAKDPMALDAVGFDLGAMCSYLVGITSMGFEQVEGEDGTVYDTEHLLMMDNDGYIWDFWVYARDGGGYDALYNITGTDLRLEFPGYDNMEHMFTSLMAGEDGNLYLAAYTGETSELYHLAYDEIEEKYLAVKIGDMGDNIWPATITSVTVNGGSVEPTVASPAPKYTMSATTISREQMEAAASKVRFAVTDEEKDAKLGINSQDEQIVTFANGNIAENTEGYYEIYDAADLVAFAALVNGGKKTLNAKLMADIDMTGVEWTPICGGYSYYEGIFDGDNHTVSNLSAPTTSSTVGMFGGLKGTVKNLHLVNGNISGTRNVGGIAGNVSGGTITNCSFSGSVTGSSDTVGGIAGYVQSSGIVADCHNAATVTGSTTNVGGVVGQVSTGTVSNCSNTGSVNGKSYTGGVVGYAVTGTITDCFNEGAVNAIETEKTRIGGIAGYAKNTTVENCYNAAAVTGAGQYVAGLVGYVETKITITNCYNTGVVTGRNYTAGIVCNTTSTSSVSNCFNMGTVIGASSYVGAMIGSGSSGTISNNYYLAGCAMIGETVMNGLGNYNASAKADTAGATDGKDAAWFASAEAVAALNAGGEAWIAGTTHPLLAVFGTPEPDHTCNDGNNDHKCDTCGATLSECAEGETMDHKCDVCGATVSQCNTDGFVEHKDAKCDEDGVVGGTYCTICNNGKAEAEEAIPAGHNYVEGICSGCGAADPDYNPEHTCADADNNHKCDTCSATLSECAEGENKNHKCDVCGATLSECAEGEIKDHKCDVCGAVLSECTEGETMDHKCDVCGAVLSECAEGEIKDHKCDVCGATVSQCNTDGVVEHKDADCDEDGVVGGTYCTICNNGKAEAEEAIPAGHNYVEGICSRCGQEEAEQNILVLGNNTLESGKVYTYTATKDGGLQMVFSNLLGSDGEQIIDYVYGRGLRVRIMLNGNPVYRIKDETRDNETKITVSAGDKITLELVPVDSAVENHFVVTLNLSEATPPVALSLGENSLSMKTYYSFIAPADGTLYTTIKELYYDGSYVSEVSLNSTVLFKINGVAYKQFRNQIEVKAGDEISFQLDASFKNHSTNAFLDLSYEGFYEHPIGTRGNPYTVTYADCPTETVKIPGGTYVWYKLIGFSADAYLTITGENAYVIVGGTRVDARNGSLTIPAYSTLQIGNAGAQEMSYQLSAYIPEGTQDNPKDLVVGDNSATVGERESYYFDHVATQSGKMTAVISGSNWMYEVFWYAADGALMQSVGPKYGFQGDAAQISVNMSTGQTVVIRVTTMTSSFSQPGGTVSVNFQFTPSGGTTPEPGCQHPNAATIAWQYNDNQHWKVCDSCQQQIFTASHSYENGVCVCGKTDPNAGGTTPGCQHSNAAGQWQFNDNQHWQICDSCQQQFNVSSHGHGNWVNGKKTCFCGHQITCDHANVGAWQSDNNEHWQICGTCGLTVNRASHSYGADNKCVCGKEKPDHSVVVELKNEVDTTNGVVQFTWDPAKMTLVNIQIHTDYFSMVEAEGSLTVGYISLNAIEAGKTIVTLTFEAVDPADADVSIVHKEINNSTVTECVHTSVTYTVSKAPTTAKTGALEGVCNGCGETFSVTLPALNIVDYTYQVIEPATETKDGTGRYTWKVTTYGTFSFDVVIPHDVTEQDAQVVIESSTAVVGGILRLEVLLQNNPGIQALSLLMNYDASVMSFVGVSNGTMMDLDVNTGYNRLLWSANAETTTDGVLCVLEFRINENAQVGTYTIDLTLEQAVNGQGQEVQMHMVSANIEIVDMVFGDANADGVIDLVDLVLLRSYLANRDPETGISSKSVTAGADANGDGTIGLADVMLLRQYLVNRNPATGESSVVLGPQN